MLEDYGTTATIVARSNRFLCSRKETFANVVEANRTGGFSRHECRLMELQTAKDRYVPELDASGFEN
jgi:hypothetical protein